MKKEFNILTDLPKISGPKNLNFFLKFFIWLAILVFGGVLFLFFSKIMGIIVTGLGIAHGIELAHQALHDTGFTNSKLNRVSGFLFCFPSFISFSAYRHSHLIHHRLVGTKEDSEFFTYNLTFGFFKRIFNFFLIPKYIDFLISTLRILKGEKYGNGQIPKDVELDIKCDIKITGLLLTAAYFLPFGDSNFLSFWLISQFFVAGVIHTLIELPEHFNCEKLNTDIKYNTRTIQAGRLMTWFTNGNNYHIEHHEYPLVLPEFTHLVHPIATKGSPNINESYIDFVLNDFFKIERANYNWNFINHVFNPRKPL